MKTVQLYSDGKKIADIENVKDVVAFDKGYIRIHYKEGDEIRMVETNMPFIYYNGGE